LNFPKNCNIILINLDGLRRDKIEKCTALNSLKQKSFYFSKMNTVAPYTFASLHSVFSSLYPSQHGVNSYYNIFKFRKDEITTLAQSLQKNNYFTCCDVISKSAAPESGFDEYNLFDESKINFIESHKKLINKLSSKEKFFLFLHYTETHKHLVREIVQKYGQESNDDDFCKNKEDNDKRYDSFLPGCSDYVSAILDEIKNSGIEEKTIVIFFSDHGTSIGEKQGEKFYGVFAYDYTLNVFCIIKIPEMKSKISDKQCLTLDIYPTILDMAGINLSTIQKIQGRSLFDLDSEKDEREVFVETGGLYGPWPSPSKHNVFCIKYHNFKLIYNDSPSTWEYYNLENDPDELENIYDKNLPHVQFLKERLLNYFKKNNIIVNHNINLQ